MLVDILFFCRLLSVELLTTYYIISYMNESTDKEKLTIFGKNLKLLRTQQNISQEEFADKTKLDRTYISGLERGKRNPSFLTLIKLAQTLNISVEKLFYGEKNDLN